MTARSTTVYKRMVRNQTSGAHKLSPPPFHHAMLSMWQTLSWLGDSRALLPMAFVLIGAGLWRRQSWASRWCFGLVLTVLTTLASKIAFLGWGLGIACLDFTGFSGHAAMSAAVWPVACYLAISSRRTGYWGAAVGLLLAAFIAYSRLPLNAHSWSEITGGWLIGAVTSISTVMASSRSSFQVNGWMLPLALVAGMALFLALPDVHIHEIVVQLSKTLAGTAEAFDRSALRRG